MRSNANAFDFIVAGGGPAGTLCALQLARAGARVALLHRPKTKSHAVEIVSARARAILERHIGDLLQASFAIEVKETVSLWGSKDPVSWNALCDPWGCGISVDRVYLDQFLLNFLLQTSAIVVSVRGLDPIERRDRLWQVRISSDRCYPAGLCAPILVLATGRSSMWFPDRRPFYPFPQVALTARWDIPALDIPHTLYLEAVENGWWYAVPDARSGHFVGFCARPRKLKCRQTPLPEFFRNELSQTSLLATVLPKSIPASICGSPASEVTFDRTAGDGWIAIGDAAYASDPLSGQGIHFAVESAQRAAIALTSTATSNGLMNYQHWIDAHVTRQIKEASFHRRHLT